MTLGEIKDLTAVAVGSAGVVASAMWLWMRPKVGKMIEEALEKHHTACSQVNTDKLASIEGWVRSIDTRQEEFRKEVSGQFRAITDRIDRLFNGKAP